MIGRIEKTDTTGGSIRTDDRQVVYFKWSDCNFKPNDVGHDSAVHFMPIEGTRRASKIKRFDVNKKPQPRNT